ncbi:MAG: hypothetical protein DRJ61_06540 [Acidobacteria bacterium]|nr:MAG: hypothetical protein DRJ65_05565 [Acidobacteriota bacterium]RLE33750.1 MAG: hypothetical protein DRJ61_06540 [Acidobacteriota bacterium]
MTRRTLLFRTLVLWAFFEIIAAAQVRGGPSGGTILSSWVRALITPPITAVEGMTHSMNNFVAGFRSSRALAWENQRLTNEMETLKNRNATLLTDLQATLQAAENLRDLPLFSGTPARCLYRDVGRGLLLVSLGPGAPTIDRDTPVLGGGGVVGRVIRIENQDCWIESLTHAAAAIAVTTSDGLTHGLAEGTGGPTLEIRFVSHRASLTVGQELVTSGADGIYLPGFPVATITSIRESDGPFLEITAHPVADPTTVQSVWLLHDHNPTEGIAQEDS